MTRRTMKQAKATRMKRPSFTFGTRKLRGIPQSQPDDARKVAEHIATVGVIKCPTRKPWEIVK